MPELAPQPVGAHFEFPDPALLEVEDLHVSFKTRAGVVRAVDGLSLTVGDREVLGIVGESGSGKSVAMYSILGLVRDADVEITGSVRFRGHELLGLSDKEMCDIRGNDIAMIFQDPMTALTPVYTVGWQIAEQVRAHEKTSRRAARDRAISLLAEVGIPDPARRVDSYPHEFSGGMRQRVVIAMALSCSPRLLIADEPTTALDVTTQAQILALMRRLQETHGSSIVIITHDMGVISELADRVVVMYAGRPVEVGPKTDVIRDPQHPYTWGLLGAVPRVDSRRQRLATIPGSPVSPLDLPPGCAFAPRCACRFSACDARPPLAVYGTHRDACWLEPGDRARLRAEVGALATEATRAQTTGPAGAEHELVAPATVRPGTAHLEANGPGAAEPEPPASAMATSAETAPTEAASEELGFGGTVHTDAAGDGGAADAAAGDGGARPGGRGPWVPHPIPGVPVGAIPPYPGPTDAWPVEVGPAGAWPAPVPEEESGEPRTPDEAEP